MSRTPPASVMAWSSMEPGGLPSNSQERSSRSWARASATTCCGWSARRWISARVCSTESCTREAMSARSSARTRACRSTTRSRAMRSHHGPSSTTMAEISSATPARGCSSATFSCADCSAADAAGQQDHRDRQPQDQPGPPGAGGQAEQRLGLAAHHRLLVLGGVAPDQDQSRPDDGHREEQRAEPPGPERRGEDAHHDQHGPEARDERQPAPVGHAPCRPGRAPCRPSG